MIIKLFKFCFVFLLLQMQFAFAADNYKNTQLKSINCAPKLQKYLMKILNVAEVRALIIKIQQEGPFQIEVDSNEIAEEFGAYWDEAYRTICVNFNARSSEGEVIGSILFELHNAAANSQLEHYNNLATARKINRESYIRAIEHIEYENSKKAAKIAEKGIALGVFPVGARLPTYRNFEEHYHYQKIGGHSAVIGHNYDLLIR